MTKKEYNFRAWCQTATHQIRYGPDRKAVEDELMAHLQDAYDAAIANGLNTVEAEEKALDCMGSAQVIAPQLAAIHNPFWGYFLRVCKVLLVVLLVLSLKPLWDYSNELQLQDVPNNPLKFDAYNAASYADGSGRTLLHLSHPDLSFTSDINTFTVTDVALFTQTLEDGTQSKPKLFILIRQTSPLPWAEHKGYFQHFQITSYFSLRDSLGNVYKGYMISAPGEDCIYFSGTQSGIFQYTHQCCIFDFPAEAKWVELSYERDGRSICLRIPLTGGVGT